MANPESMLICGECHTLHDSQRTPVWDIKDTTVEVQCVNCRVTMLTAPNPAPEPTD